MKRVLHQLREKCYSVTTLFYIKYFIVTHSEKLGGRAQDRSRPLGALNGVGRMGPNNYGRTVKCTSRKMVRVKLIISVVYLKGSQTVMKGG